MHRGTFEQLINFGAGRQFIASKSPTSCSCKPLPSRKCLNMIAEIVIRELMDKGAIPYDLLLKADPSKDNIDRYIIDSVIYTAEFKQQTVGCCVLCNVDHETIEIKNIVVDERFQGRGIGTLLLDDAIQKAKSKGFKKIIIGTGNSSIGQLYLYQKVGFRISGIKVDFFRENYSEPIFENGIECRDMIVLEIEL
jgi:ribosomal protein S18 acetylase RimI-like enzyme